MQESAAPTAEEVPKMNGSAVTAGSVRAVFSHDISLPAPIKRNDLNGHGPLPSTTPNFDGPSESPERSPNASSGKSFMPIAVCGMACRLPGNIASPEDLWKFLAEGGDARSEVPSNRWNASAYYSPVKKPGSSRTKHGYFLDESVDIGALDTSAFPMGRTELERLDPQQRLLLEVSYECLEDSGESDWQGSDTGVYVGCFGQDWYDVLNREGLKSNAYQILGSHDFMVSERVSHELDLRGPSLTIRTACSSSMIGLNEACMAIAKGDCRAAIVGGTSLFLSPSTVTSLSDHGVFSPDGSSKTFSANANGFARGEAIVAIYIKSLDDAVRDGNPIRAVIAGMATNFDGRTPNMSMPSAEAQEAAIRRAYQVAGIPDSDLWRTGMFECHGTGTKAGDPIETRAIANVFAAQGLHLSSIKPNLGHSEGAAGVSAIMKAVLALEHRMIPPSIKAWPLNPKIPFDAAKLTLTKDCIPWPVGRTERVSVNSFGIGGANAHAILESASTHSVGSAQRSRDLNGVSPDSPQLFVLSAYSKPSLDRMVINIGKYLDATPHSFSDVAYTLALRRQHLQHRSYLVSARNKPGEIPLALSQETGVAHTVVMVFTGQGAQWPQMGRDLMRSNSTFNRVIQEADAEIKRLGADWTIRDELQKTSRTTRVNEAEFAQPLCTAIQIAIVEALAHIGIRPAAVVGHSSGEVAAAYAAGALTLREALAVAYHRGIVSKSQTKKGAMAAVGLSWTEAHQYLLPGVVVACDNSHNSVTLSGNSTQLEVVLGQIKKARPEVPTTLLKVERAYHSHHMEEVGEAYLNAMIASKVVGSHHSVPFFSSVTGLCLPSGVNDSQLGPLYWQTNLQSPVRFKTAVIELLKDNSITHPVFVEIGPHAALADPIRQILGNESRKAPHVPTLVRRKDATESFLTCIGKLWSLHVDVDLSRLSPHGQALSGLPSYPWDHQKTHWYEPRVSREWRLGGHPYHDLLGRRLPESTDLEPLWRNLIYLQNVPWVSDHRIDGDIVFPFAGFVAIAAEAIRQIGEHQDELEMRNVTVSNALPISEETPTEIVTSLRRARLTDALDSDWWDFSVTTHNGHIWTRHCTGQVRSGIEILSSSSSVENLNLNSRTYPRKVPSQSWYEAVRRRQLSYGSHFTSLEGITSSTTAPSRAAARLRNGQHGDEANYHVHPIVVDSFFQLLSVSSHNGLAHAYRRQVPTSIEHLTLSRCSVQDLEVRLEGSLDQSGGAVGQGVCYAGSQTVARFTGLRMTLFEGADSTMQNDFPLTARAEWVPHADFRPKELQQPTTSLSRPCDTSLLGKLANAAILYTQQVLRTLPDSDSSRIRRYDVWLSKHVSAHHQVDEDLLATMTSLAGRLASGPFAVLAEAILTICSKTVPIVSGEQTASAVLATAGVLEGVLEMISNEYRYDFVHDFAMFRPNIRILELAASSGASTAKILSHLQHEQGQSLFSRYVATDASTGLINAAKDRFKNLRNFECTSLNVEKSLDSQDFEDEEFDLIIWNGPSYAMTDIPKSLANIHKLLSPKGRLLVQEPNSEHAELNFILVNLSTWWDSNTEDYPDGPVMSHAVWKEKLSSAGLPEVKLMDLPHQGPTIVARPRLTEKTVSRLTLIHEQDTDETVHVTRALEEHGYIIDHRTLRDGAPPEQDIIVLLDLDKPFLWDIETSLLKGFQDFVQTLQGSGVLWITRPCQTGVTDPRYAPIIGLSRTIRSELAIAFATCEVETLTSTTDIECLINVVSDFQTRKYDGVLGPEYEYAISDGTVLVNRFFPFEVTTEVQNLESALLKEAALAITKPGQLNTLHWKACQSIPPGDGEVQIEIYAAGVNFRDILVSMGILTLAETQFGYEAAGIVKQVGSNVSKFSIGDRVVLMGRNTFATTITLPATLCQKLPDAVSFVEGAGSPLCFTTALYGLVDVGRLEQDQSVLIHSAAGGVGIAAIQVAQMVGATIYATVSSTEKRAYLKSSFGIPEENIFDSRSVTFVADLMRQTGGAGVDVALNSLSGELLHQTWNCVAKWGTMIEIGKRDLVGSGKLDMKRFAESRNYCCIDMDQMTQERPKMIERLLQTLMGHFRQGTLQPIALANVSPASTIRESFTFMQQSKHIGKFVVEVRNDSGHLLLPSVQAPQKRLVTLNHAAAYVLIGGLGGLGQSISRYMVQRGARHLVYLSRNANRDDPRYSDFINELEGMGCTVQCVKGNAASLADVERAIDQAPAPIKGILNMTIALADNAFLRMTIDEWNTSVEPKIRGTWNILQAVKARHLDVDFLVLISSLSGIVGQTGQANYSSANTFLDAFSQYSTSQGLPCTTITSGVMESIGVMSGSTDLLKKLQGSGWRLNNEAELIETVDSAIQLAIGARTHSANGARVHTFRDGADKTRYIFGLCPTVPLSSPDSYTNLRADVRMAVYHNSRRQNTKSTGAEDVLRTLLTSAKKDTSILQSPDSINTLAMEIGRKLCSLLLRPDDNLNASMKTSDMGLDSMVAVEMSAWWKLTLGLKISMLDMVSIGTLEALGQRAADDLTQLYA